MSKDAIGMLKEDHDKVRKLLSALTETTERAEKKRNDLLRQIEHELDVHTRLEEDIFYPAFEEAGGKEHARMRAEAKEEHRAVERLVLPDLKKTPPGTVEFSGRFKVLKELVEHHAGEEEEEMFPKAQKALSRDQLVELGERMAARKRDLQKRAA